jgi:hypothetical protein
MNNRWVVEDTGYWSGGIQQLAPLVSKKQEHTANNYGPHATPNGDVDLLFFLYRKRDRSQLAIMGLLCVAETALHQPQYAGCDQHDCRNLDSVHFVSFN